MSVLFEESLGAGVVLDDASTQSVLPMVDADLLLGKSLIVTNFHVIESGQVPQLLLRLQTVWIWIQANWLQWRS